MQNQIQQKFLTIHGNQILDRDSQKQIKEREREGGRWSNGRITTRVWMLSTLVFCVDICIVTSN